MADNDPVSWKVIEPGWTVVTAGGEDVGRVDRIVGDPNIDIFDGLAVQTGRLGLLSKPRYVPSEQVASITEGRIELALSKAQLDELPPFEEPPPVEHVRPA